MPSKKSGLFLVKNNLPKIIKGMEALAKRDILVGIPRDKNMREEGGDLGNASIYYIQEFGAPEANIPARPTLFPAIRGAQKKIAQRFKASGRAMLKGDAKTSDAQLSACGLETVSAVKQQIATNTPPPLADSTIEARKRRGVNRTNTLIDTGNMQNHVSYILRNEK